MYMYAGVYTCVYARAFLYKCTYIMKMSITIYSFICFHNNQHILTMSIYSLSIFICSVYICNPMMKKQVIAMLTM